MSKRDIIIDVTSCAFHILHNSYLYGTDIWPTAGFKSGSGIGSTLIDCIHIGVNAYGYQQIPATGRLFFNIYNTPLERCNLQINHIKDIFDYTIYNNILFEDEFRGSIKESIQWFNFTYSATNN